MTQFKLGSILPAIWHRGSESLSQGGGGPAGAGAQGCSGTLSIGKAAQGPTPMVLPSHYPQGPSSVTLLRPGLWETAWGSPAVSLPPVVEVDWPSLTKPVPPGKPAILPARGALYDSRPGTHLSIGTVGFPRGVTSPTTTQPAPKPHPGVSGLSPSHPDLGPRFCSPCPVGGNVTCSGRPRPLCGLLYLPGVAQVESDVSHRRQGRDPLLPAHPRRLGTDQVLTRLEEAPA